MKIIYPTSLQLPSERAYAIQTMNTCAAFAALGHDVTLLCTARAKLTDAEIFRYFGIIGAPFRVVTLPALDRIRWLPSAYKVHVIFHAVISFFWCLFSRADVYYFRDAIPSFFITALRGTVVLEIHDMPGRRDGFHKRVCRVVDCIVATTPWTRDKLVEVYGVPKDKIIVENNGVDFELFNEATCTPDVRKQLSVDQRAHIVMYSGHLFDWKGAHVLAEAAKFLDPTTQVVFVGGTASDVAHFREKYENIPNVTILGHRPYHDIPSYMACASLFVLPNIVDNVSSAEHSRNATSPVKLFEYLSTGKPVIASDLPSIRSIVPSDIVTYVEQNQVEALAQTITATLKDIAVHTAKNEKAMAFAKMHTWKERSRRVLVFAQSRMAVTI